MSAGVVEIFCRTAQGRLLHARKKGAGRGGNRVGEPAQPSKICSQHQILIIISGIAVLNWDCRAFIPPSVGITFPYVGRKSCNGEYWKYQNHTEV